MKGLILYLLFSILTYCCFGQTDSVLLYKKGNDSIRYIIKEHKISEEMFYYKNGKIQSETFYNDDMDVLQYITYYEDGKKSSFCRRYKKSYKWDINGKKERYYKPCF